MTCMYLLLLSQTYNVFIFIIRFNGYATAADPVLARGDPRRGSGEVVDQVRPPVTWCSAQGLRAGEREQEQGREVTSTRRGRTEKGRENSSNSAAARGPRRGPLEAAQFAPEGVRGAGQRSSLPSPHSSQTAEESSHCEKPLSVAARTPKQGPRSSFPHTSRRPRRNSHFVRSLWR